MKMAGLMFRLIGSPAGGSAPAGVTGSQLVAEPLDPVQPSTPRVDGIDAPDATHRLQRLALELSTIIAVIPTDAVPYRKLCKAIDIHGRWRLVDRRTSSRPRRCSTTPLMPPAPPTTGILGDGDRYIWLDRYNELEQGS